jgi:hypothetical protein
MLLRRTLLRRPALVLLLAVVRVPAAAVRVLSRA